MGAFKTCRILPQPQDFVRVNYLKPSLALLFPRMSKKSGLSSLTYSSGPCPEGSELQVEAGGMVRQSTRAHSEEPQVRCNVCQPVVHTY